jgi:hypothetical protein
VPDKGNNKGRSKPKFRIQEAILILRQGKSHPHWREAAWHLMEYAGKDTQLLLEAQRDLIQSTQEAESSNGSKYLLIGGLSLALITLIMALVWKALEHLKLMC